MRRKRKKNHGPSKIQIWLKKIDHYLFRLHLDEGEKILEIAHRHIFIFLRDSFQVWFFLVLMPIFFFIVLPKFIFVYFVWLIFGLFGLFYHFLDWYFDAFLITSAGVIDVEKNGLFEKNSTRIEYQMIEAIAYKIDGFWPTIFNYGDVTIDKIGMSTAVVLKDAANPKKVERAIMRYQDRFVSEKSVRDHSALKDMLSEMIAYHIQNGKVNPK